MTADQFNLRDLVKQIRDETGSVDPGEIAGKVAAATPDQHVRAAYETILRDYVRRVITEPMHDTGRQARAAGQSAKVAGIRDWWRGMLDQPVHVATGWKSLAECSREDLLFAVSERRKVAEQNMAWAARYEKLAKSLQTMGVATVGDLPDGLLSHDLAGVSA